MKTSPLDELVNKVAGVFVMLSIGGAIVVVVLAFLVSLAVSLWNSLGGLRWLLLLALLACVAGAVTTAINRRREAARQAQRRADYARVQHERQLVMDREFAYTQSLDHKQFEHLVARLLRRDGWGDAYVVGGANDRGADVIGTRDGEKVVVQCKHYNGRKVGSGEMQKFLGTVFHEHDADVALFVTSSQFTREARSIGEKRGVYLMEATDLARWQAYGAPSYLSA